MLLLLIALLVACAPRVEDTGPAGGAVAGDYLGAPRPASDARVRVPVEVPEALRGRAGLGQQRQIEIPPGFEVSIFAAGLRQPRLLAWSPSGILYVSQTGADNVVALPDPNGQGVAAAPIVVASGLNRPHGLAFHDGYLYIAETNRVSRVPDPGAQPRNMGPAEFVVDLPAGGNHWTRTIGFGPDGKMYVAAGSTCNVCEESDERRAAISQYNPDGSGFRIYARGLRNSVGFVWRPGTGELWATDNGRDRIGDDIPPDELNIVVDGGDYGWPYCYGDRIPNPEYNNQARCDGTIPPVVPLQAHSAALGLAFYPGGQFPSDYQGDLFVAYHGSWNRTVPTGYKVVRVRTAGWQQGDSTPAVEDFATGWLDGRDAWGRPVDVSVGPDGGLYLTDDRGGVVYRFTYRG